MASFRLESSGEEVLRIQERLRGLGLYSGSLDSLFGGGTEAAVKAFQARRGLSVDGIVGPDGRACAHRVTVLISVGGPYERVSRR
jgi:peptidoglycan hydrolase-like protein with peptidoglycan-binding domain